MTTTPFYEDAHATVWHGDCVKVLASMPDNTFDAVITDPPYGLEFMGKDWDAPWKSDRRQTFDGTLTDVRPNPYGRSKVRHGMGESYGADSRAGRAFQAWCETWAAECLRVLKPGGALLAFGGTRTWHRLVCAVEDAGFEIRDSVAWLYGSGFPKSLDVSKAIDKRPGVSRHAEFAVALRAAMAEKGYTNTFDVAESVIGRRTGAVANWQKYQFPEAKWWPALRDLLDMDEDEWGPVIAEAERAKTGERRTGDPVSWYAQADRGDGIVDVTAPATDEAQRWSGYGTSLKPGHEPICCARKPLDGTVAGNVLKWGTGAINIDAMRIGTSDSLGPPYGGGNEVYGTYSMPRGTRTGDALSGRWPANVALDEATAVALDQQAGDCPSKNGGSAAPGGFWGSATDGGSGIRRDDSGGPSRFFFVAKAQGRWPANVVLDEATAAALDQQTGEWTSSPGGKTRDGGSATNFAMTLGGTTSYTDTGGASRFFYTAKAPADERITIDGVSHVTVKPLDLMRWLVRGYAGPKGALILDPFAGSGTTGEAAIAEGMRIVLIEQDASYLPLIKARVTRRTDPVEHLRTVGEDLGLFGLDEESL